jgi:hypothetical protein
MIKTNIKVRVNPEQSKRVQEICFDNGIEWLNVGIKYIYNIIIIYINKDLMFSEVEYPETFEEINAELFIRTNGTCEESLFDKTSRKFYPSDETLRYMRDNNLFETKVNHNGEILTDMTEWQNDADAGLHYENVLLKKKIENLHISLNKKAEKNKNQKEEITRLLKVNKSLEISEMNLIKVFDEFSYCKKLINEKDIIIKYLQDRLNEK